MSKVRYNDFNPARGGNAPTDLREAFVQAAGDFILDEMLMLRHNGWPIVEVRGNHLSLGRLICLLWNCTDIMPVGLCRELSLLAEQVIDDDWHKWRGGRTYAQGARLISLFTGEEGSARRYAYAHSRALAA